MTPGSFGELFVSRIVTHGGNTTDGYPGVFESTSKAGP